MSSLCTYFFVIFLSLFHFVEPSVVAFSSSSSATEVALPTPLSIPPSQYWDGSDGPWSSFELRVGSPPQSVRVLISTASNQPWVVLPEGCNSYSPVDCSEKRGGLFHTNQSTTWMQNNASSNGVFSLAIGADLGLHGSGYYGYDSVALGYYGSGTPVLDAQVVGGITTESFYTGFFGLNPAATNFSSDGLTAPSYISALKTQSFIPSISYGYTAGNQYRYGKTPGSLTIGGFDESLIEPNELSIPINSKDGFKLSMVIESIALSSKKSNRSLATNSMRAVIDSTVPYLYLPIDVCQRFEEAFGITYDESSELYLVNDTLHQQLLRQSASVVMTLTNSTAEVMVNVTFPYRAFDLIAEYPLVTNSTRYFPLKRATNSSQVVLGRTFLQEAYIIADYERSYFSVHQRKWDENATENIQTILPLGSTYSSLEQPSPTQSNNAIPVAIASSVSGSILITLLVGCTILIRQRRKNLKQSLSAPNPDIEKPERPRITVLHSSPPPSTTFSQYLEPESQVVSPISPATDCGPYCFQSLATQMHDGSLVHNGQTNHYHFPHHFPNHFANQFPSHFPNHFPNQFPNQFPNHFPNHFPNNFPNHFPSQLPTHFPQTPPSPTPITPLYPAQIYELPTERYSPIRELLGTPVEEGRAKLYGRVMEMERAMIREGQNARREALAREERAWDVEVGTEDDGNWDGRRYRQRSVEVRGWI